MKQFLKQRGKLLLRNGILYHKNDTQETKYPDRHDDWGHLGIGHNGTWIKQQHVVYITIFFLNFFNFYSVLEDFINMRA